MSDIFGDVGGAISGFNHNVGSGLVTAFIVLQIPLMFMFFLLSILVIWLLFGNKWVVVFPGSWKYKITILRPFANASTGIEPDEGALCWDNGISRFKLKKENVVMQKPGVSNMYPNQEIMLLSLSQQKKINAKRIVDIANRKIIIDIEDPAVADGFYYDKIEEHDPWLFYRRINQMYMLWIFWFFSGLVLSASNFMVIYPLMLKYLFGGSV